ncbi:hypothetical protein OAE01_01745 [Akkermansiaceae bacterium]|nr:hypothetical protein [Akkermansiaceae bacterium]MDB4401763.1 hypothetical protein [bacterium]MDA7900732.1 hypothetical protein [Akkermansiaceae bacterium]MDA7919628.1 hypothetical protein [Akkermansiaceae bacterium]MDA7927670.1 hypothetical protein [Akkermansiaceae bacterium]
MPHNRPSSSDIHDKGRYNSSKKFTEIVEDLNSISVLDKTSESELSQILSKKAMGCGVMVVGGALILPALLFASEYGAGGGVAFCVLLGMVLLISAAFYNQYLSNKSNEVSKDEFSDYRYQVASELLPCLGIDIDPNSNLEINLNLKELPVIDSTGQNKKEKTNSPKGERQFVATLEPILTLVGRFLDGTKFNFEITEYTASYGEWFYYRAISGKTKTKLRARKRTRWIAKLRLRYKDKRYDASSITIPDLEKFVQMPQGARLKKVKNGGSEVTLVSVTDPVKQKTKLKLDKNIEGAFQSMTECNGKKTLLSSMSMMTFLSLYQALNSCSKKR